MMAQTATTLKWNEAEKMREEERTRLQLYLLLGLFTS